MAFEPVTAAAIALPAELSAKNLFRPEVEKQFRENAGGHLSGRVRQLRPPIANILSRGKNLRAVAPGKTFVRILSSCALPHPPHVPYA